jgi:hypothetical protein
MNIQKTIIDGDLWYIDNFLTQEELDYLKPYMDDKSGWYTTMRSPYKNIVNKFLGSEIKLDENGDSRLPTSEDPVVYHSIFSGPDGIHERLAKVVPPIYRPHCTLQTFKYMTEEEILKNIDFNFDPRNHGKDTVDYAMDWHSEWNEHSEITQPILSFFIYLNDDFEGGILEFMHKPYKIKPKAGTLVAVPVTKDFTHRVTKITSGNWRHTLYGNSWQNADDIPLSTPEDC